MGIFIGILMIVAVVYGFKLLNDYAGEQLAKGRNVKCPNCGSGEIRQTSDSKTRIIVNGIRYGMFSYKCKSCGHEFTKFE